MKRSEALVGLPGMAGDKEGIPEPTELAAMQLVTVGHYLSHVSHHFPSSTLP